MRRLPGVAAAVAVLALVAADPATAQEPSANATAHLTNGTGDCNVGNRNGGSPTAFIETTELRAEVSLVDTTMGLRFSGVTGPVFDPMVGPIDADGNLDLRGRNEAHDEDYTFTGRRSTSDQIVGTFTRVAHYDASAERCTARWNVVIDVTGPLSTTLPNGVPRTQERPSTSSSSTTATTTAAPDPEAPDGGGADDGGEDDGVGGGVIAGGLALAGVATGGLVVAVRARFRSGR